MRDLIFTLFFSCYSLVSFGQVKDYNDGFSYFFFEKGTVIIFDGLLSPCLEEGQELKTVDKDCKKRQEETIEMFSKHKITPLDFQDSTYQDNTLGFGEVKKEIKHKIDTELFFFLEEQGYSLININSIEEINDSLFIQFYRGVYFNCIFTNVKIDLNLKNKEVKAIESGILKIKN